MSEEAWYERDGCEGIVAIDTFISRLVTELNLKLSVTTKHVYPKSLTYASEQGSAQQQEWIIERSVSTSLPLSGFLAGSIISFVAWWSRKFSEKM